VPSSVPSDAQARREFPPLTKEPERGHHPLVVVKQNYLERCMDDSPQLSSQLAKR
jgi:hypothetical protein